MFCNECGHENRNDRKFCSECGKPLRDYTKPRENLVMPNQVEEEKAKIINKNNKIQKLNIALVCSLIAAVLLTVISFLTKDVVQLTLAIIAFVCYLAFFTVGIIKIRIKKKKQ